MIVADTNVLSEPLRARPNERVLAWLVDRASEVALTAITVGELLHGVERLPRGRRREALREGVDQLVAAAGVRVLGFDDGSAREYAVLRASREAAGVTVSVEDSMIAAICLAGGHSIATRNVKHFADAGLEVVDPWVQR